MDKEYNQSQAEYLACISETFKTKSGIKLLKYLEEDYVAGSSLCDKPEHTFYKLGQKELVQHLIYTAGVADKLKDINIEVTYE